MRDSLPHGNLKHCLAVEKDQFLSAQELADVADQYESNFFPDGRYKGMSITAGLSGHKWRPNVSEQVATTQGAKNPATTFASASAPVQVHRKSPPTNRKLFGTGTPSQTAKGPWKCGELGHTSRAHYDTSNANYSGFRSLGKPMAVNGCEVQNTEYYDECCDETEPAQDHVPVNQCIVLESRTECTGPDVESSEGPLFNFIPERDRSYDSTIGLVPESSVVMTCESETGVNSLMPPLEYVSIDLEESDQTYKAMLNSGTMVAVAKMSLIPQELRQSVGKTRLQGALASA